MQFRQIEIFHAVMTTGSTTAAAERLRITQPAVSTTLARMQDELGLTLFVRRSNRLIPTPEADLLFRQVRALKEDTDQLRRTAERLAAGRIGHVRLGVVPALGETIVARAIAALHAEGSEAAIGLDVLNTHDLIHRLRTARLDLIACFGVPPGNEFAVLGSVECPLLAAIPSDYEVKESEVSDTMRTFPLALMRPTDPIGMIVSERLKDPKSLVEVRTSRAALAMARAGVAAGVVDALTASEHSIEDVRFHAFDPPLKIDVSLVAEASRVPSLAESKIVDALKNEMKARLEIGVGRTSTEIS